MTPSNSPTKALIYNTNDFLRFLGNPEALRKVSRIRILDPRSKSREFHVSSVSLPELAFSELAEGDVCDISSMAFAAGYNVARMRTYGRIPLDLARDILTRVDRARINFRGMPASTFTFVVDNSCPEELITFRQQSNVLMGFHGDVIHVDRIDVGRTVTNLQITPVGDNRFDVKALAFADRVGTVYSLKDSCCPLQDLSRVTPSAWHKHQLGYGGDSPFLVRGMLTHMGEYGHLMAVATHRGLFVQRGQDGALVDATSGMNVTGMSFDWSGADRKGGRLVFCGVRNGNVGFYSCDTGTLRVGQILSADMNPGNDNLGNLKIRVGSGSLFLTDRNTRSTVCTAIQ